MVRTGLESPSLNKGILEGPLVHRGRPFTENRGFSAPALHEAAEKAKTGHIFAGIASA